MSFMSEFREFAMKGNVVVDLRNIYSPEDMARYGFAYTSIGRPAA